MNQPQTSTSTTLLQGRWLYAGLLCLPALLSLLSSIGSARMLPGVQGEPRPALIFDTYSIRHDEDAFERNRKIEAHFIFENHSSRPVKITGSTPSCGCLTPKIVTLNGRGAYVECEEFAPGQVGVLAVGIRPAKEAPGTKDLNVVLHYNDGQARTETLNYQVTLPKKKLTVTPNELYFYQLTGEADSRVVDVIDYRDKPAQVTGVTTLASGPARVPLADVVATLGEAVTGIDGERRSPIEIVCAGRVSALKQDGWVIITTDDPDNREIRLPLVVFGKTQPRVGALEPESAK